MKQSAKIAYLLDSFEGPLDFLLHLIRRNEVDIYGVSIKEIVEQFLKTFRNLEEQPIDDGAEFVSDAALLMWLKSKMLLPAHDQIDEADGEIDPKFEIIHQLYDYCRFRDAGKALATMEQEQSSYYFRGAERDPEVGKPLGLEHITLEELGGLFKDALKKAEGRSGRIQEENWKVSDKIKTITQSVRESGKVALCDLFDSGKSRQELIVTFLAVLELMKLGTARVVREVESGRVMVINGVEENNG